MAKAHYSKRPVIGLSFALYSLLLEFAARELSIGRRQERIIWLADAAAEIKTERCDWLRVKPASADWLSTSIKGADNGGTSVACPAAEGNGRRPRKLRKRKEMNGTEERLWKWEIWNFKVQTSKLKLRKWVRVFKLETANCDLKFEPSNFQTSD